MTHEKLQLRSLQKKVVAVCLVVLSTWLIVAGYDTPVLYLSGYSVTASGLLYLAAVLMLAIPTRAVYYIGRRIGDGLAIRISGTTDIPQEVNKNEDDI